MYIFNTFGQILMNEDNDSKYVINNVEKELKTYRSELNPFIQFTIISFSHV